ncbi:Uncharacterised protein [uncultured archaeon]|nr:Uncharacterised protein [uncultured archaeon]
MPRQQIVLRFGGNAVYTPDYIGEKEEKAIEEILGDAVVGKSRSWCG